MSDNSESTPSTSDTNKKDLPTKDEEAEEIPKVDKLKS